MVLGSASRPGDGTHLFFLGHLFEMFQLMGEVLDGEHLVGDTAVDDYHALLLTLLTVLGRLDPDRGPPRQLRDLPYHRSLRPDDLRHVRIGNQHFDPLALNLLFDLSGFTEFLEEILQNLLDLFELSL